MAGNYNTKGKRDAGNFEKLRDFHKTLEDNFPKSISG